MKTPGSALPVLALIAVPIAIFAPCSPASAQQDIPQTVKDLRQAGPLDVQMRTDSGHDVHLRLETQYPTQDMGKQLTTEQIEKLDTIRGEAPDKYQILSCLFPQQIAEFLLRSPSSTSPAPADDAVQRIVWEIASEYISQPQNPSLSEGQRRARADFIKASLQSLPAQPAPIQELLEHASQYEDPDFGSPEKASTFMDLKDGYSPYRRVGMSIVGDTLRIDGAIVTEHLAADASAAGQPLEQYADSYYRNYSHTLESWRSAQITGNAYAGTIRRFLNDPRLADFTPEEVSRAYERVFGRDLKTDLEADRVAARLGHPVTYNDLRTAQASPPVKE
jgi:hypothetical protein